MLHKVVDYTILVSSILMICYIIARPPEPEPRDSGVPIRKPAYIHTYINIYYRERDMYIYIYIYIYISI